MFCNCKIKVFGLADLVNRNVNIRSFKAGNLELIYVVDTKTGDLFVLKEIKHSIVESVDQGR